MIISSAMCDTCDAALLALTAAERWAAARRGHSGYMQEYASALILGALLMALIVALWWVSSRRGVRKVGPPRESFDNGAAHRGLGERERRILLAIVGRSGLRRSHDIFASADAFDRGAARLLAECARTRTVLESERLRAEVDGLREKIGYQATTASAAEPASTRSIPVGAIVELLRRLDREGPALGVVVVRNDDLEIAVELPMSVDSPAGELWRVRYHLRGLTCQFDTSTVSCEGRRLILNHGEQVRPGQRVAVHAPAAVARFPFLHNAAATPVGMSSPPTEERWLDPVEGVVTEVAGLTLRIRSPLRVEESERVLVMVRLTPDAEAGEQRIDAPLRGHILGHIGRVRHIQDAQDDTVITVELVGLSDLEIGELERLVSACGQDDGNAASRTATGAPVMQGA